jgi:hypothetical protein
MDQTDNEILESLELPVEEEAQWITNITVLNIHTTGTSPSGSKAQAVPFGFSSLRQELRADRLGLTSHMILAYERSYEGKPVTSLSVSTDPNGCPPDTETIQTRLLTDAELALTTKLPELGKEVLGGAVHSRVICVHRVRGERPLTHVEVAVSGKIVGGVNPVPVPTGWQGTYRSVRLFSFKSGVSVDVLWRVRPKLFNVWSV